MKIWFLNHCKIVVHTGRVPWKVINKFLCRKNIPHATHAQRSLTVASHQDHHLNRSFISTETPFASTPDIWKIDTIFLLRLYYPVPSTAQHSLWPIPYLIQLHYSFPIIWLMCLLLLLPLHRPSFGRSLCVHLTLPAHLHLIICILFPPSIPLKISSGGPDHVKCTCKRRGI